MLTPCSPLGYGRPLKILTLWRMPCTGTWLQLGISLFHYLDDYIMVAPPHSHLCQTWLDTLMAECAKLGASRKTEGPASVVTFLGIQIDTDKSELRLLQDKLQRLKELLDQWESRKGCTRKDLESLIGLLNHACKVVRAGRSFLRRMIDLLHAVPSPTLQQDAYQAEPKFQSRPSLVARVPSTMEWSIIPHPAFFPPEGAPVH